MALCQLRSPPPSAGGGESHRGAHADTGRCAVHSFGHSNVIARSDIPVKVSKSAQFQALRSALQGGEATEGCADPQMLSS